MRKIFLIAQREYAQVVKKKSFLVGILLTPALMGSFMLLPAWFANRGASNTLHLAVIDQGGEGMGNDFARSLNEYKLENSDKPYYSVDGVFEVSAADSARFRVVYDSLSTAIANKDIKYFLVVKPGVISFPNDSMFLVADNEDFRSVGRFETQLSNLVSSSRLRQSKINLPVDSILALTRRIDLARRDTTGQAIDPRVKLFASFTIVMIIYMMILTYGQTVMRSVIDEKTSRIMEVMVSSVSPFQLMAGKLVGLGAAAFTQVAVWIVLGIVMLGVSTSMAIQIDPSIMRVVFNPFMVVSFALFLVGGYFLYSTMFALLGSIVNSDKEAQNFLFPIVIMLVLPVMIGMSIMQDPNSTLAVTLSLIPFFSPTMMVMRIAVLAPTATTLSPFSGILAQAILSFGLLALAVIGMIWLSGRIFRVGILMYGKRPTLPEIIKWVRY
ncbi:MAG: ABC transporter permease [candidate division Zixibacteria bacterium]|nr:ABC transporter permease [candidate division Zixibacteria bacterium]